MFLNTLSATDSNKMQLCFYVAKLLHDFEAEVTIPNTTKQQKQTRTTIKFVNMNDRDS